MTFREIQAKFCWGVLVGLLMAHPARSHPPSGIVVDDDNNVYFLTIREGLWQLSSDGQLKNLAVMYNGDRMHHAHKLARDEDGNFYLMPYSINVVRVSDMGQVVAQLTERQGGIRLDIKPRSVRVYNYSPLAVDARGVIHCLGPDGKHKRTLVLAIKEERHARVIAQWRWPDDSPRHDHNSSINAGMAFNLEGNLYVSNRGTRVLRITPDGDVQTFAGGLTAGYADGQGDEARFNGVNGIDVDSKGRVYVADARNRRIRKISPDGRVSTIAGDGSEGARDGPAVVASFNRPTGIAVSMTGDVYILDDWRETRIRRLTRSGEVTTVSVLH